MAYLSTGALPFVLDSRAGCQNYWQGRPRCQAYEHPLLWINQLSLVAKLSQAELGQELGAKRTDYALACWTSSHFTQCHARHAHCGLCEAGMLFHQLSCKNYLLATFILFFMLPHSRVFIESLLSIIDFNMRVSYKSRKKRTFAQKYQGLSCWDCCCDRICSMSALGCCTEFTGHQGGSSIKSIRDRSSANVK
eukprot:1702996-Amphidinium_carterae.1